jgi:type I restriction enzyme S subunit
MTRGIPKRGDVLFTMEAPMGEVGVIDRDEKFSIAQRILLLRPADVVTSEYLALALQSPVVRRAIEHRGTGSNVSGIAYKRFRSVTIPLPSLEEQQEIVERVKALLSRADKAQQAIEAAQNRAARFQQAVVAKAFRGELASAQH